MLRDRSDTIATIATIAARIRERFSGDRSDRIDRSDRSDTIATRAQCECSISRGQFQQLSSLPDRFLLLAAVRQRPLCMTASLLRIQHSAVSTVILSLPHISHDECLSWNPAMGGVSELFIVDGYQEFASSRRTTECIIFFLGGAYPPTKNLIGFARISQVTLEASGGVRTPPNPPVASPLLLTS